MWWENGDFPPLHRPCLGEHMQGSTQAWPAQPSFPYLRHLLYTRAFFSRAPLSFHTHFSLPHISLQHRFLLQHPSQFSFIYFRLRPQFEFLSLCGHVLPTLLVSRTATNAAFISCKCVNIVISPQRWWYGRIWWFILAKSPTVSLSFPKKVAERFSRDGFNIDEFSKEKVMSCFGVD